MAILKLALGVGALINFLWEMVDFGLDCKISFDTMARYHSTAAKIYQLLLSKQSM